jgi:uncharacterized cupredoxin-like copper-binding protein
VVRKILLLLAVSIPLMLAACGGDDSDTSSSSTAASTETTDTSASSTGGGAAISIGETEYALDPADPTAKAGSVTLEAVNNGSITHNLEIEGNGIEEQATEDLDPGASGEVTVDLKPGTYEIYCGIGNHREQGMEGELTVK